MCERVRVSMCVCEHVCVFVSVRVSMCVVSMCVCVFVSVCEHVCVL